MLIDLENTKENVVSVCWQWNHLATPFLYEQIILTKEKTMLKLYDVVSKPNTPSRALGPIIIRLDVAVFNSSKSQCFQTTSDLFSYTPNLVTLNLPYTLGISFDEDYCHSIPASVQHLHWMDMGGAGSEVPTPVWISFLDNHPNLKSLNCFPSLTESPSEEYKATTSSSILNRPNARKWSSIEELVLQNEAQRQYLEVLPPDQFPNLHTVHFTHRGLAEHRSFLATHGRNLTVVHITAAYILATPTPTPIVDYLHQLADHCPKLKELHWTWDETSMELAGELPDPADSNSPLLPKLNITTLGIEFRTHQLRKREVETFFWTALSWFEREEFPLLTTIRFISEVNLFHLREKHSPRLTPFLNECVLLGIRVEDHFGDQLTRTRAPQRRMLPQMVL